MTTEFLIVALAALTFTAILIFAMTGRKDHDEPPPRLPRPNPAQTRRTGAR